MGTPTTHPGPDIYPPSDHVPSVQHRDVTLARDDQTGFPSLKRILHRAIITLTLNKSRVNPTPQVCLQHPEVSGSESRLGKQRVTAGMGYGELGMGERNGAGTQESWSPWGQEGRGRNGQGAVSFGNMEDKFLPN